MRRGDVGDRVKQWQRILHQMGFGRVVGVIDGIYGVKTESATWEAQRAFGLEETGVVDTDTERAAVDAVAKMSGVHPVLAAARGELGVREVSRNRGKRIAEYWVATSYPDGERNREPWCAAFVAWCVREAMLGDETLLVTEATRPRSAAVRDWVPYALRRGWEVFGPHDGLRFPRAGDIAIYTFSHMGVVEDSDGRVVTAIEGNTDDAGGREGVEVARKHRVLGLVRSLIRLPRGIVK